MKAKRLTIVEDPRWLPFVERYAGDPTRFATEVQGIWMSEQQQELNASVAVSRSRTSVASGHGCFGAGTMVRLADGSTKPVELVQEGDLLMGPDGRSPRRVLETYRDRETLFRVSYADGGAHVYNESHRLLLTDRREDELRAVDLGEWLENGRTQRHCLRLVPGAANQPCYELREIVDIDHLGVGDYFGFLLDHDGRFLHADGTVLQNTGKTTAIANIVLWHMLCYDLSVTVLTANDMDQLKATLWKEIGVAIERIRRGPHGWIAQHIDNLADGTMRIKGFEDKWFVESKTANRKNANKMAGRHAKWLLIIGDEAATLPDEVLTTLSGALTETHNRFMLTSQAVNCFGFFYDTQNKLSIGAGGVWNNLIFSSFNSPFVSDEALMELWNAYDDDERNVRLLGLFPQDSSKLMMGLKVAQAMYTRGRIIQDTEPYGWMLLGDVASGEGLRDKSSCVIARVIGYGDTGPNARRMEVVVIPFLTNHIRSNVLGNRFAGEGSSYPGITYVVDAGGLGINVCQDLEDMGKNLVRVNWSEPCFLKMNAGRYLNTRAQAMHQAARAAKEGRLSILTTDHKKQCEEQASHIPKAWTDKGRIKVPAKGSKEWEGFGSPDLWDAICFGFLENLDYTPVSNGPLGGNDEDDWSKLKAAA